MSFGFAYLHKWKSLNDVKNKASRSINEVWDHLPNGIHRTHDKSQSLKYHKRIPKITNRTCDFLTGFANNIEMCRSTVSTITISHHSRHSICVRCGKPNLNECKIVHFKFCAVQRAHIFV